MTGTIEFLPVGSFGIDDSFGPPSLDDMLGAGVKFESRYICIDNALTHGKLWTLDRIKRNADAGILAMVNYEQSTSTTLGGETGGRKHGPVAGDWRVKLQMPDDLPIVISTDVGVTRDQYNAISDFCAAFSETGGGRIGHYHGTTLCAFLEDRGLNELTWMAMATSWSPGGETPQVHIRQKGYVLGSCDANYVRRADTPFWNFNGEALPPASIPEVDMSLVILLGDQNGWWKGLDDAGHTRSIFEREAQLRMAASTASGVVIPSVVIPEAEWSSYATELPAGSKGDKGDPGPPGPSPRSATFTY